MTALSPTIAEYLNGIWNRPRRRRVPRTSSSGTRLACAIGVPFPVSVMVDTFGTGTVPEAQIASAVQKVFDLTPGGIITTLDLLKPIYRDTAAYGHFGRSGFSWERTYRVGELLGVVG